MRFCLYRVILSVVFPLTAMTTLKAEADARPEPPEAAAAPHVVSVVRADARTGRLVRVTRVTRDAQPAPTPAPVRGLIEQAAKTYSVNPALVDSVIQVESNYNPYAVSPKGAQGLMQLMPATARRFGVKNSFDPQENIEGGVRYLKFLQDTFKDDRLAIAAYNAGEAAVTKYGNVPPYAETVQYVARVGRKLGQAKPPEAKAAEAKPAESSPEERHPPLVAFIDAEGKLHLETR
jgi:soluble lytic murein transglycosylase-like protein